MREVHIPNHRLPFAAALRIPVKIKVFRPVVPIAVDVPDGEVVDGRGNINIVITKSPARPEPARGVESGHKGREVRVRFLFACFLFRAGNHVLRVNFIKGAERIEPVALEKAVIAVFHHIHDPVKTAIEVDTHGMGEMPGGSRHHADFMAQGVAGFRFVRVIGQQLEVLDPVFAFSPEKTVIVIRVEIVALLREGHGRLPAQLMPGIVIKVPEIIEAGPESGVGGTVGIGIGDEPMEDGQPAGVGPRREGDRPEIPGRVKRVVESRELGQTQGGIHRLKPPAQHLAGTDGAGGDESRVNAVAGDGVRRLTAVVHPHGSPLGGEHDAGNDPNLGDVVACFYHLDGDEERRAGGGPGGPRDIGVLRGGVVKQGPRGRYGVGGAGGGRIEISRRREVRTDARHDNLRQDEKVAAAGSGVESLDGQHIRTLVEQRRGESDFRPRLDDGFVQGDGGPRVVDRGSSEVRPRDFDTVDPRDKTVLVADAQFRGGQRRGAGQGEGPAEEQRGIHIPQRALAISVRVPADKVEKPAVRIVADAGLSGTPRGIVEGRADIPSARSPGAYLAGGIIMAVVSRLTGGRVGQHAVKCGGAGGYRSGGDRGGIPAVGKIGHLRRKAGPGVPVLVYQHRLTGGGIGPVKAEVFPTLGKGEVGMERQGRIAAVLVRCPDHEVTARCYDKGRESPLRGQIPVVGDPPAFEVHRSGSTIVDFNPIGTVAVFIPQAIGIVGQKFTDPDKGNGPLGAEQDENGQQEQREAHGGRGGWTGVTTFAGGVFTYQAHCPTGYSHEQVDSRRLGSG